MHIEKSEVADAIKNMESIATDYCKAETEWRNGGKDRYPQLYHCNEAEERIATAKSSTINDAIMKLEYGVEMMEEFTAPFNDGVSDSFFEIVKAALSDLRRLTN